MTLKYERTKKCQLSSMMTETMPVTFRNLGNSEGCGNVCAGC